MLDDVDQALITRLRHDGRMSWAELGTTVGLSAAAARDRVERLTEEGIARPCTLVDPAVFGYTTRVNLCITVLGDPTEVIKWCRARDGVIHLVRVVGRFTLFAEYVAASLPAALDFASVELGGLPNVVAVEIVPITAVSRWRPDTRPNSTWGSTSEITAQDVDLLRILVDEPRIGLAEMAERLDRPYAALRRRVRSLYDSDVIRATAVVDDAAASGTMPAVLLLTRRGDVAQIRSAALGLSEVTILVATAGRFAFVGELVAGDLQGLDAAAGVISATSGTDVEYLPYVHVEKLPGSLSFTTSSTDDGQP